MNARKSTDRWPRATAFVVLILVSLAMWLGLGMLFVYAVTHS